MLKNLGVVLKEAEEEQNKTGFTSFYNVKYTLSDQIDPVNMMCWASVAIMLAHRDT